ncbi:hypothetical protein [Armatimonas sp.]|uniref:hypothetical protein n=1 Tax=Armatimonas sp. TaxID=1872638 RepID=UPI00286B296F|nr:hypothetical protein [Armatimonas sp.]
MNPKDRIQEILDSLEGLNPSEIAEGEEELATLEKRLGLSNNNTEEDNSEPDAPVPAPLLPRTPVLTGGNARRLEDAIEESESEK